jgi:hypothetical protein
VSDRTGAKRVVADRPTIASVLGVGTAAVDAAVLELTRSGLVRGSQAAVTISDRDGLELASCECYEATGDLLHDNDSRFTA